MFNQRRSVLFHLSAVIAAFFICYIIGIVKLTWQDMVIYILGPFIGFRVYQTLYEKHQAKKHGT